jgi:uncharacterized protein (TIGR02246 family)
MTNEDLAPVEALYFELLAAWNAHDAERYASVFAEHCTLVGFDGSEMTGRREVADTIGAIFRDHVTAAYVAKVREVRLLAPGVAMLRSAVSMVPPGADDLNEKVNAIQVLVAHQDGDRWLIDVFQNTPAAFHGRPEAVAAMSQELREVLLREKGTV